jgi:hypothetical protein
VHELLYRIWIFFWFFVTIRFQELRLYHPQKNNYWLLYFKILLFVITSDNSIISKELKWRERWQENEITFLASAVSLPFLFF